MKIAGLRHKGECNLYGFKFSPPNSMREWLFAPRDVEILVNHQGNIIAQRMQRWLCDNGNFYNDVKKSIHLYDCRGEGYFYDNFNNFNTNEAIEFLNQNFIASSFAGQCFYYLMSSMMYQFIEQFVQCGNYLLNYLGFSAKTKLAFACAFIFGFALCSQQDILSLYVYVAPIIFPMLLENFSFVAGNLFKQMGRLSGTKNFNLEDFISRNFQIAFLRSLPFVLPMLPFLSLVINMEKEASIAIRKVNPGEFLLEEFSTSNNFGKVVLEVVLRVLSKTIFDLIYIIILKTFFKNVDLRDPIDWMFSKFKNRASSKVIYKIQEDFKPNTKNIKIESGNKQKKTPSLQEKEPFDLNNISQSVEIPQIQSQMPKEKTKTRKPSIFTSEVKKVTTPKQQISDIDIKVGSCSLRFKRIELSHLSIGRNAWGVIINDSIETQTLGKFEKTLLNGIYGKSIRSLKDACYEIRPSSDERLIGTIYHGGVYFGLQQYMSLEKAMEFTREFEKHIDENVSLIVFSDEAKKHNKINKTKRQMLSKVR